jgi:NAD(P)-dependent dehydrogenase (short-subunit alcohol dehydrogenase family)
VDSGCIERRDTRRTPKADLQKLERRLPASIAEHFGAEKFERRIERIVPLKRQGSPSQVAEAIVFLAGDKSQFTTGASLVIDGGWTAQ